MDRFRGPDQTQRRNGSGMAPESTLGLNVVGHGEEPDDVEKRNELAWPLRTVFFVGNSTAFAGEPV